MVVVLGAACLNLVNMEDKKSLLFQGIVCKEPTNIFFPVCYLPDTWLILHRRGVQTATAV